MSSGDQDVRPITADIGWRVGRLRIRRGLSQNEVARRTGKHTSFISRVERPQARLGVPKRETIEAILDAIQATPDERAAVFQVEFPPPTRAEIRHRVEAVKAQYEHSDLMVLLLDGRWVLRYCNRRYRELLQLSADEYRRVLGTDAVFSMLDRSSPFYSRYPDDERLESFSLRAAAFRLKFAEHQFAAWYLELEERIRRFPHAEQVWHTLPVTPVFADLHELSLCHPDGTRLRISVQLRQIYDAPTFTLIEMTAADPETEAAIERLAPPKQRSARG